MDCPDHGIKIYFLLYAAIKMIFLNKKAVKSELISLLFEQLQLSQRFSSMPRILPVTRVRNR